MGAGEWEQVGANQQPTQPHSPNLPLDSSGLDILERTHAMGTICIDNVRIRNRPSTVRTLHIKKYTQARPTAFVTLESLNRQHWCSSEI